MHFTPQALADFLARRIVDALRPYRPKTLEVLDPSCGEGELLRAFIEAVPVEDRARVKLVGIENDANALSATRARLQAERANYELLHADFLDVSASFTELPGLAGVLFDSNTVPVLSQPDVIIANPPYVRTQVLGTERAQRLAARYRLRGRIDLYHAFLIAMTDTLLPGGLLGVITSNRFLTTRSGETIRTILNDRYDLIEIIDLGDTKLFSAAVLPAIVVGRKRNGRSQTMNTRFTRVYESSSTLNEPVVRRSQDVLAAIESGRDGTHEVRGRYYDVASGSISFGKSAKGVWRMTTTTETAWTNGVEASTSLRICDLAKVRVGIKTTADSIFIRKDWSSLPPDEQPENELLHPIYTHNDVARWRPCNGQSLSRILYTHQTVRGKRCAIDLAKYPRALKYLESNRERLEQRTFVLDAGRQWFEIWVPQDPAMWDQPKLVFPDISIEPRFFFDDSGALVNGDCYWLTLPPEQLDLLFLIQGTANSAIMVRYHDMAFQNRLYSGRRRFISQYVERYPIPDPKTDLAKAIIAEVKELNSLKDPSERARREVNVNELVAEALGVKD
jgi:adenine-specific DNA-methyltransferase